jgi:ribosomal protein S27AE
MKYAQYCPECSKQGIKSELKHEDSKIICARCGYNNVKDNHS